MALSMKDKIKELLLSTKRAGIEDLIKEMEKSGFFTAPCSSQYHLCQPGGLAEHSLNVFMKMTELNHALGAMIPRDSLIIVSILHDLGKSGMYGKPNYVKNMVKSKKKNPLTNDYDMVQSESKPYMTNTDLLYEEHEIRSVIIASKYIDLTEEEASAILHHNAQFGKLDSGYSSYYDRTKISMLLHFADLYCSRFVEVKKVTVTE